MLAGAFLIALSGLLLGFLALWYAQGQVRLLADAQRLEAEAWQAERRELLNRIQAPHLLPTVPVERFDEWEPEEPDGLAEVGTITFDPEYGA